MASNGGNSAHDEQLSEIGAALLEDQGNLGETLSALDVDPVTLDVQQRRAGPAHRPSIHQLQDHRRALLVEDLSLDFPVGEMEPSFPMIHVDAEHQIVHVFEHHGRALIHLYGHPAGFEAS